MTILFYDTETTGLPKDNLPPDHASQPRIVQLGLILAKDDGTVLAKVSTLVHPGSGAVFEAQAVATTGINADLTGAYGIDSKTAALLVHSFMSRADLVVAHNEQFDWKLVSIEFAKHGLVAPQVAHECTAVMATPILNLPPTPKMKRAGYNHPKKPSLAECVTYFFGRDIKGAHDALVDVLECMAVWCALQERAPQHITDAEVHGAEAPAATALPEASAESPPPIEQAPAAPVQVADDTDLLGALEAEGINPDATAPGTDSLQAALDSLPDDDGWGDDDEPPPANLLDDLRTGRLL